MIFGFQNAEILYAGPAPGQVAGITQINIRVPQLPPAEYTFYVGWGPFQFASDFNAAYVNIGP